MQSQLNSPAITVIGEKPYAETDGDRDTLEFRSGRNGDTRLLRRLKAAGLPIVTVFLSGRPLWVNRELNATDAFVAAWLPGSEGRAVAEVLPRASDGSVAYDFIPVCCQTCHSEERSDEESGWGKTQINLPPPRSLAALGMTSLLHDRWQTGIRGRLSYSWPRSSGRAPAGGGTSRDPLFPFGFGLSLADNGELTQVPE